MFWNICSGKTERGGVNGEVLGGKGRERGEKLKTGKGETGYWLVGWLEQGLVDLNEN